MHSRILTMRTVVYVAAAYAFCAGSAEAFAPMPVVGLRKASGITALRMGEDPNAVMARVNAMMNGGSVQSAAASMESAYAAPAAAPSASTENPDDVMARVNAMMSGQPVSAPSAPAPAAAAPVAAVTCPCVPFFCQASRFAGACNGLSAGFASAWRSLSLHNRLLVLLLPRTPPPSWLASTPRVAALPPLRPPRPGGGAARTLVATTPATAALPPLPRVTPLPLRPPRLLRLRTLRKSWPV